MDITLDSIAKNFSDEDKARELMEHLRWPDGKPICPHCGAVEKVYRLTPKAGSKTRKGLLKCGACRKQFTVTVGTIFEDSHIPLSKWLMAIQLLCASKKGMSAHQLHRMLGMTYKSAWFMAHRIRYAMTQPPLSEKLRGIIEVDETYIGGKGQRPGRNLAKAPVVTLIERGGPARSHHVDHVTTKNLREILTTQVDRGAKLVSDDFQSYRPLKKEFPKHRIVKHSTGRYVHGWAHTNTVEGFYAILKRGINGVYHHVSKKHLHRYLSEFDFRYNRRAIKDGERASQAVLGAEGKRLMYSDPTRKSVR